VVAGDNAIEGLLGNAKQQQKRSDYSI